MVHCMGSNEHHENLIPFASSVSLKLKRTRPTNRSKAMQGTKTGPSPITGCAYRKQVSSAPHRSSGNAEMLEEEVTISQMYIFDSQDLTRIKWINTDAALQQQVFLRVLSRGHMAYVSTMRHWSIGHLRLKEHRSRNQSRVLDHESPCSGMPRTKTK